MYKALHSKRLEMAMMAGVYESERILRAKEMGIPAAITITGLKQAVKCGASAIRVATHVTEADASSEHIAAAKELGIMAVGFLMMASH